MKQVVLITCGECVGDPGAGGWATGESVVQDGILALAHALMLEENPGAYTQDEAVAIYKNLEAAQSIQILKINAGSILGHFGSAPGIFRSPTERRVDSRRV